MLHETDALTAILRSKLSNPGNSSEFDLPAAVEDVLRPLGLTITDSGGHISFYGQDPIIPSSLRFGAMSAIGLAAKAVAVASIWRDRTGEGQDIAVDVRKSLRRFCGFFDGKWETINGRPPSLGGDTFNPFFETPLFRATKDGRHVIALNIYPQLHHKALNFLGCTDSSQAINDAILNWKASDLEIAGTDAGLVFGMVRTWQEFLEEEQYKTVLSTMPLITIEKIADSDPVPFSAHPTAPLSGIRALGMGHVIAGAAIGRDLAYHGADVLNTWRPNDTEIDPFAWDVQVGMRSTILSHSKEDRAIFDRLLSDADIFFANKRPGYLNQHGLSAAELCAKNPGLIHASVVLHGETGPWANRPGFDEIGAAVAGLFCLEGEPGNPKQPPVIPICDNVVGWLGTVGILAALRRRAKEGGSYRVVVSLTRSVLWLLSMGIFDKTYAKKMAGSSDEHFYAEPDLFTAETPLGTYQGMTDQVILSKTPGTFKTILVPRGSSKPEWLT